MKSAYTPQFTVKVISKHDSQGVTEYSLKATDKFHGVRHAPERAVFRVFVNAMEAYLKRHPELNFEHPKNHVRKIVYFPPALKAWAAYMPGGFATHYVHNPDHKKLKDGKKVDYITRNLFRHSADAIGLRSRAYVMMWFLKKALKGKKSVTWLSIASGTGQATYDAVTHLDIHTTIHLLDIDDDALEFAKKLAPTYGIDAKTLHASHLNVTDEKPYEAYLKKSQPDVVEAMGLAEYLDDETLVSLIKRTLVCLKPGSVFIFTNMLSSHPHLEVHKRGLGWPGVIPRSVEEVTRVVETAGVSKNQLTILRPSDKVYAVYAITIM